VRLKPDEFDDIIKRAIRTVIRERLEEGEPDFQDQVATKIKSRGIKAPPEKKSDKGGNKDKDSEERDTDEADDEEGPEKGDEKPKKEDKPAPKDKSKSPEPGKPQIKIDLVLPDSIKPDDIEKKLNLLRSGKSLKDEETKKRFDTYFSSLSAPQKVALKGFLDGLSQVILGEIPGTDAKNPSDSPYNVKMDADPDQESERKKPTRPTKSSPLSSKPSGTNTPIVVGESSNKSDLLRLIKSNARD
jgi:hypothetical protein